MDRTRLHLNQIRENYSVEIRRQQRNALFQKNRNQPNCFYPSSCHLPFAEFKPNTTLDPSQIQLLHDDILKLLVDTQTDPKDQENIIEKFIHKQDFLLHLKSNLETDQMDLKIQIVKAAACLTDGKPCSCDEMISQGFHGFFSQSLEAGLLWQNHLIIVDCIILFFRVLMPQPTSSNTARTQEMSIWNKDYIPKLQNVQKKSLHIPLCSVLYKDLSFFSQNEQFKLYKSIATLFNNFLYEYIPTFIDDFEDYWKPIPILLTLLANHDDPFFMADIIWILNWVANQVQQHTNDLDSYIEDFIQCTNFDQCLRKCIKSLHLNINIPAIRLITFLISGGDTQKNDELLYTYHSELQLFLLNCEDQAVLNLKEVQLKLFTTMILQCSPQQSYAIFQNNLNILFRLAQTNSKYFCQVICIFNSMSGEQILMDILVKNMKKVSQILNLLFNSQLYDSQTLQNGMLIAYRLSQIKEAQQFLPLKYIEYLQINHRNEGIRDMRLKFEEYMYEEQTI